MAQLWQRQEWETPTAFDRFEKYFLVQKHPRSVDEAYRRYRQERGTIPAEKSLKTPGSWTAWGWPPGKPTWHERGLALDDHLANRRIAELEAQHMPPAEVLARLSAIARGDMGRFAEVAIIQDLKEHPESGLVKAVNNRISENAHGGITNSMRLELYSALEALEKLARHYGLFNELGGNENNPFILKVIYGNDDANNPAKTAAPETD